MLKLQTPNHEDKVLLHSCCAPCSSAIIECLLANGIRPTVFYYNPNIYPQTEYEIRKSEAIRYVQGLGLDFIDGDYDYSFWRTSMQGMEDEPERGGRCLKCFNLRLAETARYASKHGFTLFTTTLSRSGRISGSMGSASGHGWLCRHCGQKSRKRPCSCPRWWIWKPSS